MNIDKLILSAYAHPTTSGFGSLMNIDKLIHDIVYLHHESSFGSLMNIDKLIPLGGTLCKQPKFWLSDGILDKLIPSPSGNACL